MLSYDPFSPEVIEDPYPHYRRLRDQAPAYYAEAYDTWFLSRFSDVWNAGSDRKSFTATRGVAPAQVMLGETVGMQPSIAVMDPAAHTEMRALIADHFKPGRVASLEAPIREMTRDCLEGLASRGAGDVVAELASHVTVRVSCRLLGMPIEDADYLVDLVTRFFTRADEPQGTSDDGTEAYQKMLDYLTEFSRRRRGADGAWSDVCQAFRAAEPGSSLSDEHMASRLFLLVTGATETLPRVFAKLVYRLWEHPEQRAEVASSPALIPDAIQETLRYDMPTQMLGRRLARDLELHGQRMRAGQGILFLYASANRDEREFPDPDRFDIHRRAPRIASFGSGIHMCIGSHVARLEARVMLEELLARFPEYEIDAEHIVPLRSEMHHGFAVVPIHV